MNVITHTFVGLKCLTETKIQILCDHVDHTRFHIVEMGCQMVQRLSAHIVSETFTRHQNIMQAGQTPENLENAGNLKRKMTLKMKRNAFWREAKLIEKLTKAYSSNCFQKSFCVAFAITKRRIAVKTSEIYTPSYICKKLSKYN